jgi:hypothetical protein
MAQFIEALTNGLTVQGRVLRSGQRVQVSDAFPVASKRDQVKRWGAPRYKEISRGDYEGSGGEVKGEEEVAVTQEPVTEPEAPADPFAAFDGLNVEETLALAATLDEADLAGFIAHEQENANRKSVLAALGVVGDE